jgi:beta-glucosidase
MGSVSAPELLSAYEMFVAEEGQEEADENWKQGAYDCVLPIFKVGNFENPYVVAAESNAIFKQYTPDATNELAQSSIVMLKNDAVIMERAEKAKVYITANGDLPASKKTLKSYFDVVDDASEAEFALVFVNSPANTNTGYDSGKEAWVPITLQYRPYTADGDAVEEDSLTGDIATVVTESPYGPVENKVKENRGYYDAENAVSNEADLDLILETAKLGIPVVVCVNASGAFCVDEFESEVAAILVGFGVDKTNFLPLVAGQAEPSGLLPLQMPANMEAVEDQASGTPRDMDCYEDAAGNTYDFAFGLNWAGQIEDERTERFAVDVQVGLE